jgi:hypothetical protein
MPNPVRAAARHAAGPRTRFLAAATCLLAVALATACAAPAARSTGVSVSYTCCKASLGATTWHPGQQVPIVWTRTATATAGQHFEAVTLSATLTGPFSKVVALKAAITQGRRGSLTLRAPKTTISHDPPVAPVTVISIPAGAPPGFYNLRVIDSSGGGTVTGSTIITIR